MAAAADFPETRQFLIGPEHSLQSDNGDGQSVGQDEIPLFRLVRESSFSYAEDVVSASANSPLLGKQRRWFGFQQMPRPKAAILDDRNDSTDSTRRSPSISTDSSVSAVPEINVLYPGSDLLKRRNVRTTNEPTDSSDRNKADGDGYTSNLLKAPQLTENVSVVPLPEKLITASKPIGDAGHGDSHLADGAIYGTLVNVTMYALAWQLFAPMIPYFLQDLGGDQIQYGYLMGLSSFTQMIGAFFGGPLIDRYGPKYVAIVSYISAACGFILAYLAQTPWQSIMSRLPNLFTQALLASRTFVTTRTRSDPKILSYVSLAYGLGSMFGPAIASWIVRLTPRNVQDTTNQQSAIRIILLISTIISVSSAFVAAIFMPPVRETGKERRRSLQQIKRTSFVEESITDSRNWLKIINEGGDRIRRMLIYKSCISLSSALFHAMIPLILADRYQLGPENNGWIFSFIGIIVVVAQLAFNRCHGWITAYFFQSKGVDIHETNNDLVTGQNYLADNLMLVFSTALMAASFAVLGFAENMLYFTLLLIPIMSSGTVIFTLSTSMLTRSVDPKHIGTIIGLDMAATGVLRVIAPLLGTWVSAFAGDFAIGITCAIFISAAIPAIFPN